MTSTNSTMLVEGWKPGPNTRGTTNILSTCVFAILACTWSIQHLNLPAPGEGLTTRLLRRLKWMLITIVLPEYILVLAIEQWSSARESVKQMKRLANGEPKDQGNEPDQDGPQRARQKTSIFTGHSRWQEIKWFFSPNTAARQEAESAEWQWTTTHAYFANMGGFHVVIKEELRSRQRVEQEHNETTRRPGLMDGMELRQRAPVQQQQDLPGGVGTTAANPAAIAHHSCTSCEEEERDHLCVRCRDQQKSIVKNKTVPITANHLATLIEDGILSAPPNISEEEISDKSKGDFFTKLVAFVQIVWLVISVGVRVGRLPITQLEVATIAFALNCLLTYFFTFGKPQDVSIPYIINTNPLPIRETFRKDAQRSSFAHIIQLDASEENLILKKRRIPNDCVSILTRGTSIMLFGMLIATMVIGGIHCWAWDFHFPYTMVEKWLWRVASIASMAVLPVAFIAVIPFIKSKTFVESAFAVILRLTLGIYTLARLCLLGEAFASLRSQPEQAYSVPDWITNILHMQ